MNEKIAFETLLANLTFEEYNKLIALERLKAKGWVIHYVVDCDMITNYCFPAGVLYKSGQEIERFTNRNNIKKERIGEYLADEQITLHSLFYVGESTKRVIVFDEYLEEIRGLLNIARKRENNDKIAPDWIIFDRERVRNVNVKTDEDELKLVIKEDFSMICANILLKIEGLIKIKDLVNQNRLIFESADLGIDLIQQACDSEMGSENGTEEIYQIFVRLFSERQFNESGKRRDSRVIERLLKINNYIQRNGKINSRKHVFLLLTESPTNKDVINILKNKKSYDYPYLLDEKIALCCSTSEIFAQLICAGEDNDHEQIIENLEKLRDADMEIKGMIKNTGEILASSVQSRLDANVIPQNEYKPRLSSNEAVHDIVAKYDQVFSNYKNLRNSFENIGLFRNFESIYKSIEPKLKDGDSATNFFNQIIRQQDALMKELGVYQNNKLRELIEEAQFNTKFIEGLELIRSEKEFLDFSKGNDMVEGRYQHLPVLFKPTHEVKIFSNGEGISYNQGIYTLIKLIFERQQNNQSELAIKDLMALIDKLYRTKSRSEYPIEEKIIKAFLFLLLPDTKKSVKNEKTDHLADKWLHKIEKAATSEYFLSEILYLQCWTARRITNYSKAIDYANKGILAFPSDPRFHHGLFLAMYNIYASQPDKKTEQLNELLSPLKSSFDLYPNFIRETYYEYESRFIVSKINDTFFNNFCFIYTEFAQLYFQKKQHEAAQIQLKLAREYLDKLKVQTDEVGKRIIFREQLPEYYDTEALLEYQEAEYLKKNEKIEKLNNALAAIDNAILLSNHPELRTKYQLTKATIENRLSSLRTK